MQVLTGVGTFYNFSVTRIVRMIRATIYQKFSKFVEVTAKILSVQKLTIVLYTLISSFKMFNFLLFLRPLRQNKLLKLCAYNWHRRGETCFSTISSTFGKPGDQHVRCGSRFCPSYRAMHSADYAVERCLSVLPSHAGSVSKRLNVGPTLKLFPESHTILVFAARCYACMPSCGVCVSVRPSVTFVDHVKTNKRIF